MDVDQLLALGGNIAVTVVLAVVGLIVSRLVSQQILRLSRLNQRDEPERQQQLETLIQVIRWATNVAIVAIALMMLLGNFVDVTPLLASAGVAGLAISLGAQSLIKDLLGGIMILVEGQYAVGDVIKVGDVSGSVERLTLRTTQIRDINGNLIIVPNGDVRTVSNVTKDWSRAVVKIGVAYEEDMDRVLAVLEGVVDEYVDEPEVAPLLLERPVVLGPLGLGDWAITVQVMVKTPPGKQWGVARELRKRILAACEREHIVRPYPRQELWVRRIED